MISNSAELPKLSVIAEFKRFVSEIGISPAEKKILSEILREYIPYSRRPILAAHRIVWHQYDIGTLKSKVTASQARELAQFVDSLACTRERTLPSEYFFVTPENSVEQSRQDLHRKPEVAVDLQALYHFTGNDRRSGKITDPIVRRQIFDYLDTISKRIVEDEYKALDFARPDEMHGIVSETFVERVKRNVIWSFDALLLSSKQSGSRRVRDVETYHELQDLRKSLICTMRAVV